MKDEYEIGHYWVIKDGKQDIAYHEGKHIWQTISLPILHFATAEFDEVIGRVMTPEEVILTSEAVTKCLEALIEAEKLILQLRQVFLTADTKTDSELLDGIRKIVQ